MKTREQKFFDLYLACNELMAILGLKGEVNTRTTEVESVMDALHELDDSAPVDSLEKLP